MISRAARQLYPHGRPLWKVGRSGASQFHDAAVTQMTINAWHAVAQCAVREESGQLCIAIVPRVQLAATGHSLGTSEPGNELADTYCTTPVELEETEVLEYLKSKGFTGSNRIKNISFVTDEYALPATAHERVVLSDLLDIAFRAADTDGDGRISFTEFEEFAAKRGLSFGGRNVQEIFLDYDEDRSYDISFAEFKDLLLKTRLVALQDNT